MGLKPLPYVTHELTHFVLKFTWVKQGGYIGAFRFTKMELFVKIFPLLMAHHQATVNDAQCMDGLWWYTLHSRGACASCISSNGQKTASFLLGLVTGGVLIKVK